jgi:hypothetical protein
MVLKRGASEDVYDAALQRLGDTVKATLPESQDPAVAVTPAGSTSERRRPPHPEIKLSSPVRSGGGAMSSELIQGSERETYVALDTFLDDEPRDGLRDASPTVTEFP